MNDLNLNLLHSPVKSSTRRILGFIYTILGILWLTVRILGKDPEEKGFSFLWFDILYFIVLLISGAAFILEGSGISIGGMFGEAYIRIDQNRIAVKKGVFSKEWSITWDDVEKIEVSILKITFSLKGNIKNELNYDNLDYEHIQILKAAIKEFGNEKSIPVSGL